MIPFIVKKLVGYMKAAKYYEVSKSRLEMRIKGINKTVFTQERDDRSDVTNAYNDVGAG